MIHRGACGCRGVGGRAGCLESCRADHDKGRRLREAANARDRRANALHAHAASSLVGSALCVVHEGSQTDDSEGSGSPSAVAEL